MVTSSHEIINILSGMDKNDPEITKLKINEVKISVNDAKKLSTIISKNTYLRYLNLRECNISNRCMKYLMAGLQKNSSITELVLDYVKITSYKIQYVKKMLEKNNYLEYLSLEACCIDNNCLEFLVYGLKRNTTLKYLNLHGNNFPISTMFSKLILYNRGIETIDTSIISNLYLYGSSSCNGLKNALGINTTLKKLNMKHVYLEDKIYNALKNCNLEVLNIYDNNIKIIKLANSIKNNISLKKISFNINISEVSDDINYFFNIINDINLEELEIITSNSNIIHPIAEHLKKFKLKRIELDLCGTYDNESIQNFCEGINLNTSLKSLTIFMASTYFLECFSKIVIDNTTLEILDLMDSELCNNEVKSVVNIIKNNKFLKEIHMDNIKDDYQVNQIKKALKNNVTLKKLKGIDVGDMLSPEKIAERRNKLLTKSSRK